MRYPSDHLGTVLKLRLSSSPIRLSPAEFGLFLIFFSFAIGAWALSGASRGLWVSAFLAVLCSWISVIDLRRRLVPNALSYLLIGSALILSAFHQDMDLLDSVLGGVAGFVVFGGVALAYQKLRQRAGLGWGDVKLMAGVGAWIGAVDLPWVILIGSGGALVFVLGAKLTGRSIDHTLGLPFAPAICSGFWIVWLFSTSLRA